MSDLKKNSPETAGEELGFNEAELQDIMSEIENLEKEFMEAEAPNSLDINGPKSNFETDPNTLKIDPKDLAKNELQRQIDEELENSLKRLDSIEAETTMVDTEEALDLDEVEQILDETENTEVEMADVTDVVSDNLGDSFDNICESEAVHETYDDKPTKANGNIFKMPTPVAAPGMIKSTNSTAPVSFQAEGTMALTMSFNVGSSVAKLSVQGDDGLVLFFEGVEIKLSEETGCVVEMDSGIKFNIPLTTKTTKRNVA